MLLIKTLLTTASSHLSRRGASRVATVVLAGALLGGVANVSLTASGAWVDVASAAAKKKPKKDFSMSPWMAAQLTKAQEQADEKKYKDALATLKKTSARGKLSLHEEGSVHRTEGYIYITQSKYKQAAVAFEKTVATDMMPDQVMKELHNNLGQIYQVEKKYTKSLKHYLRWFAMEKKPKGDDYYLIANSFLQTKRRDRAISWARKAIKTTRKPKENWLQLLSGLLFEKEAYKQLPAVLNQMATLFPKKIYYDQLYVVEMKLKHYDRALAVLELEYYQGFFEEKDDELQNLAMLYIQNGVPLKGAKVMAKGLKSGEIKKSFQSYQLHAECLLGARAFQEALKPLAKAAKAAKGTRKSADMYLRIAEIHLSDRKWGKARSALSSALGTGKLKDKGTAHVLTGIANFWDNKKAAAKTSFLKAKKIKASRRSAEQWLMVLKSQA